MIPRRASRVAPALVAGLLCATLAAFATVVSAATGASAGSGLAVAAPSGFRGVDAPPTLRLTLTEVSPVSLTAADTLRVRGIALNSGTAAATGLRVRLRVNTAARLTTRADLAAWANYAPGEAPGLLYDEVTLPKLAAGASKAFTVEVAASQLRLGSTGAAFGPYGIAVDVISTKGAADDAEPDPTSSPVIAGVDTTVVWHPIKEYRPTSLSVVAPIVRNDPTTDAGAIDPSLAAQFAPDGRLSRAVAATRDSRVAWALDPSLLAAANRGVLSTETTDAQATPGQTPTATTPGTTSTSSTSPSPSASGAAAGTGTASPTAGSTQAGSTHTGSPQAESTQAGSTQTQPASSEQQRTRASADAKAWLNAVRAGIPTRDVLAQPWADPDVVPVAVSGDLTLLRQADRWARETTRDVLGSESSLAVAVPVPAGVDARVADTLAGEGRTTLVVPDANRNVLDRPDHTISAGFMIDTGDDGTLGLASDSALSATLAQAGRAGAADQVVARQRVLADLAAITLEFPSRPRSLLASLPRDWQADPPAFQSALAALAQADWVTLTPIHTLAEQPVNPEGASKLRSAKATTRGPEPPPLPESHLQLTSRAFDAVHAFAPALVNPEPIVEPLSVRAVSIVAATWRGSSAAELAVAREPLTATARATTTAVRVGHGGPYNLLTTAKDLPLVVSNELAYPVDVVLRVEPRLRIVRARQPVPVRIEAETGAAPVQVHVQGIANGNVAIDTWLETPDGHPISPVTTLEVRVRRNWESRGLGIAVAALLLLLVVGLWRSVRSGRGKRRTLSPDEPAPDVDLILAARERREIQDADQAARRETPAYRHLAGPPDSRVDDAGPSMFGTVAAGDVAVATRTAGFGAGPPGAETSQSGAAGPVAAGVGAPSLGAPGVNSPGTGGAGTGGPGSGGWDRDLMPDAGDSAELPEGVSGTDAIMRSSLVMAAGTASSRLLGFVRAIVLATAIGTAGLSADAFSIANKIPNIIYILLAGGVLNAVLVPQITRAAREGERGKVFVDRLLSVSLVLLVATTVVITFAAPSIVRLYSGGDVTGAQLQVSTMFAYWCLPQVFFYGLYTLLGQVLNARGHFGAYMWAPVLNNIVAIAGLAAFVVLAGEPPKPTGTAAEIDAVLGAWWTSGRVALLAGTATLGVIAQALVLIPVLRRIGFSWRFRWGIRGSGLGGASRIALWTFGAVLISQAAFVVTSRIITNAGAGSRKIYGGEPAVDQVSSGAGNYDYAYLLFMLPHSLIAVSLVTALFTRLSISAGEGDGRAVRDDISLGLRITGTATAGATAAVVACAPFFTTVANFNIGVAYGAMAMSLGLIAFSAQYLLQRVFYAYEDARTPFMITLPVVAVTVLGALASGWLLDPRWVLVGIGLTMSAGNLLAVAISLVLLRRRLGDLDGRRVVRVYAKLLLAAGLAAGAGWLAGHGLIAGLRAVGWAPEQGSIGRAAAAAALLTGAVVVLAIYAFVLKVMNVTELSYVLRPLAGLLRRKGVARTGTSTRSDQTEAHSHGTRPPGGGPEE